MYNKYIYDNNKFAGAADGMLALWGFPPDYMPIIVIKYCNYTLQYKVL